MMNKNRAHKEVTHYDEYQISDQKSVLVHRKMEKSIRSVREFEFVFILSFCRHGGML
jgi:hypothetical protein